MYPALSLSTSRTLEITCAFSSPRPIMGIPMFAVISLTLFAAAYGYTCSNDGTFYHADVATGCQVYHFCENSMMTTLNCPPGQAFDHHTRQCGDASVVHCEESEHHHHHKRSVDEVHTISIEVLKDGALEVLETVKAILNKTLQETAPTVYESLYESYIPLVKQIKEDLSPFLKENVLPKAEKFCTYSKRVGGKMLKRIQQSWELSNSTHINVVSFADVLDEISKDAQPFLHLGRYLSSRFLSQTRTKRSADIPITEVPELMLGYLEPMFKNVFSSLTRLLSGDENTLTSKLIIPVIQELVNDPETLFDMKRIFWSAKAAYAPLVYDMLQRQSIYSPEGTIIRIPKASIDAAKSLYYKDMQPIVRKIMEKHLPMILLRSSEVTPLIFGLVDRLKQSSKGHGAVLQNSVLKFFVKYHKVLRSSGPTHLNTYTLSEIKNDLKPIEVTAAQILLEYLSQMDNSWISVFFNRDSFIFKALLGSNDDTYAAPSGQFSGRPKPTPKTYNPVYRSWRSG